MCGGNIDLEGEGDILTCGRRSFRGRLCRD